MKRLICLLVLVTVGYAWSQPLPEDVLANIKKRIENGHTPSVAVGIIDKNGARYYNFGTKTLNGAPVDEHTIYEIGSISKVFTAILLAQAVQDGKLKLDDPIKKYLPADVKVPTRNEAQITLGHLSDHTSGLPRMPGNFSPANPANPFADYTVKQLYEFISGYELTRDIGEKYEYSNLAVGLLGHLLAMQAGTTYEELMIKTIARPLGMNETKNTFNDKMKKNLAMGYSQGKQVENWDLPTLAGAGAIRSSTSDMLKFLAANMGLTKTSLRQAMDKSHEVRHDKAGASRVGLGWHIMKGKNGDVISHGGGTGGYRTFAGFVKETGMGVVVFTNSNAGADDIGFHLLNPDAPLQTIKPSAANEMRDVIEKQGIEAGIAQYYKRKKTNLGTYDFNETALNDLGYSYMDKNLPVALAVLKLAVEQFPTSSNAYDSYGEALLKNGQKELAIENYKKSVELNPANTSGIEALKKLGVNLDFSNIDVPESTLDTYLGTYELQPGFNIEVTREGKQLFTQATGQSRFEVYPKSQTEFYLKVVVAQISFNIVEGKVESLTLFQNGRSMKGKKVK
jgi:D-alanyl-D-alanine-carboxypeptidase/D-alanyl-D-alanine-endopeptidase